MEKIDLSKLINKAKEKPIKQTVQKVVPVVLEQINEVQFSFYIDKILLKQLKARALEEEQSIKYLINESIKTYLSE